MNIRNSRWVAGIGALVLAGSVTLAAQSPTQTSFNGTFDDTTPSGAGSWEVRGTWSLQVLGSSGKADFSAALTMIRSDLWVISTAADPNSPAARNAHTHHVAVKDGLVTAIDGGFRVTGGIAATSNGNAAFGTQSTLQIDIVGGNSVELSNIKMTFGGAAANHFGAQPVNGVIRGAK